jgi:hypothetical protein
MDTVWSATVVIDGDGAVLFFPSFEKERLISVRPNSPVVLVPYMIIWSHIRWVEAKYGD